MTNEHEPPERWKDAEDVPARIRDVLRAGTAVPKMPDDVRAALLAALPSPGPAPAPTSPAASKGLAASQVAIGVGATVIVGAVAAIVWLARSTPPEEAKPSPFPVPAIAPSIPASAEVEPRPSPASSAPAVSSGARAAPPASAAEPSPAPSARGAPDSLAQESALIDRARSNLRSSPNATLAALDEHGRRFPRGELAPEREYLRIGALRRLGRIDEAKAFAKGYLAKYPSSPHAGGVRTFLAEATP